MENITQGQWFGTSGADLGEEISQSLRFTDSQRLVSADTMPSGDWTFSCWYKPAIGYADSGRDALLTFAPNYSYQFGNPSYTGLAPDGCFMTVNSAVSGVVERLTNGSLNDSSAWYHIVLISESDTTRCYINGVKQDHTGATPQGSNPMSIGSNSHSTQDDALHAYLAEINMLDGTVVGHTTTDGKDIINEFGRYNADDIWVPKKIEFTAAQYGAKGFRLTLDSSQSSGIGTDSAPTGTGHAAANNFTGTAFDEYSADVKVFFPVTGTASTAALGTTLRGTTPNGNGGTGISVSSTNHMDVDFGRLATSHTLTMTNSGAGVTIYVSPDGTENSWVASNVTNGSFTSGQSITAGNSSAFRYLRFTCANYNVNNVTAPVGDNDGDVDYKDTPTNNNAIFNSGATLPGGISVSEVTGARLTLTSTSSGYIHSYSSIPASDFDCYCEIQVTERAGSGLAGIGVGDSEAVIATGAGSYVTYREDGSIVKYPGNTSLGTESSYTTGDILGMTVTSTQVAFYKNGTLEGTYTHGLTGTFFVTGMAYYNSGNVILDYNFGQREFNYTVPTGFKALKSNNLPTPTIKNSKKHFDCVLYNGSSSGATVTGLSFKPDLVWVKRRNANSTHHILADSVRGVNLGVHSSSDAVEFDDSSTVTAFNSNGFTVGNNSQAGASGGTFVGWCWKAGTSYTPTVTGFTNPSASINTTAGFGIYKFTGNNTASSFTHGLNERPQVVFAKALDAQEHWAVFGPTASSDALSATATFERLNDTTPLTKGGNVLTAISDTTLSFGSYGEVAGTGDYIYYCWHSVPGFSKFGTYDGNDLDNGTFVHTGFKPAWVMIKRIDTGNGWNIVDNAREPENPCNITLSAEGNTAEDANYDRIDMYSNGFKQISAYAANNGPNNSSKYMYMAFAEHPFGGEDTPPVTAR
jgi:hypothetical protein